MKTKTVDGAVMFSVYGDYWASTEALALSWAQKAHGDNWSAEIDKALERVRASADWMRSAQLFDRYEDRRCSELNREYEDRIKEPTHG